MRYLADILTFSRFILSLALFAIALIGEPTGITALSITLGGNTFADNAFIVFLIAELTDVFDGTCSRRWPFPKGHVPKYRRYAALYDEISDALLAAAQVLFVTLKINYILGLAIIFFYVVICGGIEFIVYGKLFGHPDNCTKNSLARRNFPLARKIVLVRRFFYTLTIGVTNAIILFDTTWPLPVKIVLFLFGCSICLFAWFFLRQRRQNISRDAVNVEQALTKEAHKKH